MLLGVTVNSRSDSTNEHKINYDCTCESEQKYQFSTTKSHLCDCKPRKGTETHTISNTD